MNYIDKNKRKLVIVAGPTAVGKTHFAINLALALNGEIINCDSMQIYKHMNIGSAKPTKEEQSLVPHYLVDEISPLEPFSVAKYQKLAKGYIETIFSKGKLPIVSGGTGLYINSILYDMDFSAPPENNDFRDKMFKFASEKGNNALHNMLKASDPEAAERIHYNNVKKIVRALEAVNLGRNIKDFSSSPIKTKDYAPILLTLTRNREELYDRINKRVDLIIENGLIGEVKDLLSMGLNEEYISMKGIGYKEIIGYLQGKYDLNEAIHLIKRNTRHLAKRQITWFKRYDDMTWFNISDYKREESCISEIITWLKEKINE